MKNVKLDYRDQVAVVTLSREETMNALNTDILAQLDETVSMIESKLDDLRCIVFTGEGNKSFVAGADVAEMNEMDPDLSKDFCLYGNRIYERIYNLQIPTIAAVNGYALGGGCELAMACDLIIAADNAVFGLPETGLGLIPGYGGTFRMANQIGIRPAKWLMFTGARIKAQRAYEIGLVSMVYPHDELMDQVFATVEKIKQCAPLSVIECKNLINNAYLRTNEECIEAESVSFDYVFHTEDRKMGTQAFVDKVKKYPFNKK